VGEGGEMTQTLYAHMNKRKKNKFILEVEKKRCGCTCPSSCMI
jgi:hypothetical protein